MAIRSRQTTRAGRGADRMFHELRLEHARFGRVLSLIGRRSRAWVNAPDAETLQLLKEAVEYVVSYQNRHHHPREDLMFERIAERSPDHADALAVLRSDHEQSDRAGQGLLRQLRRLEQAPASRSRREALASRLESFARGMHDHIRREDELMYSSAQTVLRAADWRALARSSPTPPDPLGAPVGDRGSRYPALAQYVASGEAEARVATRPSRAVEVALSQWTQFADRSISVLRLMSRQAREARQLGLATYAAALRPALPRNWSAGVTRALNAQCLAASRWKEEWRTQLGLEQSGAG